MVEGAPAEHVEYLMPENAFFKTSVLPQWGDAMITTCLHAVHKHLNKMQRDPDNPASIILKGFTVPEAVLKFTAQIISQQHPLHGFIAKHLTLVEGGKVSVDVVFTNFRRFGENNNDKKIRAMTQNTFIDSLTLEEISVQQEEGSWFVYGYELSSEVVASNDMSGPVAEGSYYEPPVHDNWNDGRKRARLNPSYD
jgi:hypothetical protein